MSRGMIAWQPDSTWPDAIEQLEIDLDHTGLLVVDLQYACATPEHGFPANEAVFQPEVVAGWGRKVGGQVVPNTQRLLGWFRAHRRPVVYTRVGSFLPDGRDMTARRRESNLRHRDLEPYRCAVGDFDHGVIDEVAPLPGELVIDKNASGAFAGSPLDFYLRNLGLQTLVACGIATQACVQHTVRAAADIGYNVILVSDACSSSPGNDAAHERTLEVFGRVFGAVKTSDQVLADLDRLAAAPQAVLARS